MKNSLPNIEIPFKWMLNCTVSTISVNMGDLLKSVELFDKNFRWPLLAFCCRIELTIDELISTVFFCLFQIDFDEENKRKEKNLFISYFSLVIF